MITVLAGVNGAGKSSVFGSAIRAKNGDYFNPDEAAQKLITDNPSLSQEEANSKAWLMGKEWLEKAISEDLDFTFESTLGANTIPTLLKNAIESGIDVRIMFCGLTCPELHIQRVQARVSRGGHDIPEAKIRERWVGAIRNLCTLIPGCKQVVLYDNSADLVDGKPQPHKLFAMHNKKFVSMPTSNMPEWAKPLAAVAINTHLSN